MKRATYAVAAALVAWMIWEGVSLFRTVDDGMKKKLSAVEAIQ